MVIIILEQEEQATLPAPEKDENSREVFGLIKKLKTVPDAKRKPKTSCKICNVPHQYLELYFVVSIITY